MSGDVESSWLLYLFACVALMGVIWFSPAKRLAAKSRALLLALFVVIFCTPVAVPGTDQLAPAWLVAAFEAALGHTESAQSALVPIASLGALFLLLCVIFLLAARRRH